MVDGALVAALAALPPALAVVGLGTLSMIGRPLRERGTAWVAAGASALALALAVVAAGMTAFAGPSARVLGEYYAVGAYSFQIEVISDQLGAAWQVAVALAGLLVTRFSATYLHRDPGHLRFFALLQLAIGGGLLVGAAGSLDLIFFGWELVGLSSALLIAYFHERPGPVAGGLWAFVTMRVCDLGLLSAALVLHHAGAASLAPWPAAPAGLAAGTATAVGLLVLVGAMGKSAQAPVAGWLVRAMEGPSASSAFFYGAVASHLGAFLLLRCAPLLEAAPVARVAVGLVGAATAALSGATAQARPDAKGALAWATSAQLGLIFVEIAAGLYTLALVHVIGHMGLRLSQLLRAPGAVDDARRVADGLGGAPSRPVGPPWFAAALYGFHLDGWLDRLVVRPTLRFAAALDRLESRMERWIQPPGGAP